MLRLQGAVRTVFDYDGDDRADLSVFRPSNGAWYLQSRRQGLPVCRLAFLPTRSLRRTLMAMARPMWRFIGRRTGTWYWLNSSNGAFNAAQFGVAEDLPTPADYDGDGRADISVFRPSNGTWYRLNSSNGSFYAIAVRRERGQADDSEILTATAWRISLSGGLRMGLGTG